MTATSSRLVALLLLASCAPPAAAPHRQTRESFDSPAAVGERLATIRARSDDRVGAIRPALLEAVAMADWMSLVIDEQAPMLVETAKSRAIDELETLIDVQVTARGVRVGTGTAAAVDAVEEQARPLLVLPRPVFLVRGDGDARVGALVDAITAIKRAGAGHVIIGATTIGSPLPTWDNCPFPAGQSQESAVLKLIVDFDEAMRPSVVHVKSTTVMGFAPAAALCIVRHRYEVRDPDVRGKSITVNIRFRH